MLTLLLLGCVVGFLVTNGDLGWFLTGFVLLMLLGFAQQVAEWLGLDEPSRRRTGPGEYFLDLERTVLEARPASRPRSIGDLVRFDGDEWAILDAERDDEGDFIYLVERT